MTTEQTCQHNKGGSKMKCPDCHKRMIVDIENNRYICECGYEIVWITQRRENGYEGIYT